MYHKCNGVQLIFNASKAAKKVETDSLVQAKLCLLRNSRSYSTLFQLIRQTLCSIKVHEDLVP